MKIIKYCIALLFISVLLYLATYKSTRVTIEGTWDIEKIILQGKKVYPLPEEGLLMNTFGNEVVVNEWKDSLYINIMGQRNEIRAKYITRKGTNGKHTINLVANEKALNGNFRLTVDTIFLDKVRFQIRVSMQADSTLLQFKRYVITRPWEPRYPSRGGV